MVIEVRFKRFADRKPEESKECLSTIITFCKIDIGSPSTEDSIRTALLSLNPHHYLFIRDAKLFKDCPRAGKIYSMREFDFDFLPLLRQSRNGPEFSDKVSIRYSDVREVFEDWKNPSYFSDKAKAS